jgi:ribokinase
MMRKYRVAAIGDLVADLITGLPSFPIQDGDFRAVDQIYLEAGGNANFLITAARLGLEPIALGAIGDDQWGQEVLRILQKERINTSFLATNGTTTLVQVLIDEGGGHAFLGKYGEGKELGFREDHQRILGEAAALFCSGYSFSDSRMREFSRQALAASRHLGLTSYFDSGPSFQELEENLKKEILEKVDVLMLTEEEIPAVNIEGIPAILISGPELVILKKGALGCVIYQRGNDLIEEPGYPVEVVDTTAAGDSFDASFIAARCWGWSLRDCARFGNVAGAAKVKKMGGGQNVPDEKDIREIIAKFQVDLPKLPLTDLG